MGRCVFRAASVVSSVGPLTHRTMAEDRMESRIFVGFWLKSCEYIVFANGCMIGHGTALDTCKRR